MPRWPRDVSEKPAREHEAFRLQQNFTVFLLSHPLKGIAAAAGLQKDQPHLGGLQLLGHPPVVEVKLQVPVPDAKLQLPQRLVVVLRRAASSQRTQLRGARPRGAGARRRAAIALQP